MEHGEQIESDKGCVFLWVLREVLAEQMTSEQRDEAREGWSQVSIWEKTDYSRQREKPEQSSWGESLSGWFDLED